MYEQSKELNLIPENIKFESERPFAVLDLPGFSHKQIQKEFDSFHYNVYKFSKNKSMVKSILFAMRKVFGHNYIENAKNKVTLIFCYIGIKSNLIKIIQKS